METSIRPDTTHQPSICSTSSISVVSQTSSVDQQVINQFAQMKTMLTFLTGTRHETTRTAFCNYLASEVQNLEEREFQAFKNEAVKLLSGIQSSTEERNHQPQQPTLSRSPNTTSTYVPQSYQPQPAATAREYILSIPETQLPASQVIQPAQHTQVVSRG